MKRVLLVVGTLMLLAAPVYAQQPVETWESRYIRYLQQQRAQFEESLAKATLRVEQLEAQVKKAEPKVEPKIDK